MYMYTLFIQSFNYRVITEKLKKKCLILIERTDRTFFSVLNCDPLRGSYYRENESMKARKFLY